LARNLHRQGKIEEAREAIDTFLKEWDGSKREEVWRYLRTSGLGPYVDQIPPRDEPAHVESLPESPSTTVRQGEENKKVQ
jgi:hypothetical protein